MPSVQQSTKSAAGWDDMRSRALPTTRSREPAAGADELCAPAEPFDGELCIYHYFDVPARPARTAIGACTAR